MESVQTDDPPDRDLGLLCSSCKVNTLRKSETHTLCFDCLDHGPVSFSDLRCGKEATGLFVAADDDRLVAFFAPRRAPAFFVPDGLPAPTRGAATGTNGPGGGEPMPASTDRMVRANWSGVTPRGGVTPGADTGI